MPNEMNNVQKNVEMYLSHVTPEGDWRHAKDDTPIMSKLVMQYFSTRASKGTKLDYHNDVIDAITDNNKLHGMATEALRALDGNLVNIIKTLANDTVNIHGQCTTALIANELRREFIQAQYTLSGTEVGAGATLTELNMEGASADVLVKLLASLDALNVMNSILRNMNDNIMAGIPFMAAAINNTNNAELVRAFRQMCSIVEMFGVLKPILISLHQAAKAISGSGVATTASGITIDGGSTPHEPSMGELMTKVTEISNAFAPYGNNVPKNIMNHLSLASPTNLMDISSILQGVSVPIINSGCYLGALSTAYSFQQVPNSIQVAPRNYTIALLYIAKMSGDRLNGRDCTTGEIANVASEILGQQVVSAPNYRCSVENAISYDMEVRNSNATVALSKVLGINDLFTFAQTFLACNGPQPILTKEALREYVGTASLQTSAITPADVSGFLESKGYDIKNSVPHYKAQLLNAIANAANK